MEKPKELEQKDLPEQLKENLYQKDFFNLQLDFIKRIQELTGCSLEDALLNYTSFYKRFELTGTPDASNEIWQKYLSGIKTGKPILDWTYEFYLERRKEKKPESEPDEQKFGCFNFNYLNNGFMELHFSPKGDKSGQSPLSEERKDLRMQELKNLFTYVKGHFPDVKTVLGATWLLNLEAFKRVLPPEAAQPREDKRPDLFWGLSIWGQFVDRKRQLRPGMVKQFTDKLADKTITDPAQFFPLPTMQHKTNIQVFYDFYGIE